MKPGAIGLPRPLGAAGIGAAEFRRIGAPVPAPTGALATAGPEGDPGVDALMNEEEVQALCRRFPIHR